MIRQPLARLAGILGVDGIAGAVRSESHLSLPGKVGRDRRDSEDPIDGRARISGRAGRAG